MKAIQTDLFAANVAPLDEAKKLIAEYGSQLALVVNHSGGKDSQRMLGYIRTLFPTVKTYVVMADTGFEHVKPVDAKAWVKLRARDFGLDVHIVRNPNKTYLEMVERRGMFPAPGLRQCTSDLKRGPIEKFIRHLPEKIIINCTGIRAAESSQRAKQNPWMKNEGMSKAGRLVFNWMPIFDLSLTDVLQWHWENQIPLHPVYIDSYHRDGTKGGYLRRFSCRVCIFSTPADLHGIHANDPEAFHAVSNLEQRMGFTMQHGRSLLQIIGQEPGKQQYGSEEAPPCI